MNNATSKLSLCLLFACITIFGKNYSSIFPTISAVKAYCDKLPENPKPDNADWQNVSYKNFFYSRKHPGFWATIKDSLYFTSAKPSISDMAKIIVEQIQRAIDHRQKMGYKEAFVSIKHAKPGTRYVIMANLNGSFHSLVNFLIDWKNSDIIDDNFIIQDPYILAFDGNIFTDSPYGLDTLSLVLHLLEMNTERVFIIKGNQEGKERWLKTNLNFEIDELLPAPQVVKTLIGTLFDTFPLALYIIEDTTSSIDLVRICNHALEGKAFDEKMVASLLQDKTKKAIWIDQQAPKNATKNINVRALIQGSLKPINSGKGLTQEETPNGKIIWNIQSGNTAVTEILYRFFYESYIILDTPSQIKDWSIKLYSHDTRKNNLPEAIARYNLLTGNPIFDKEVQQNKIREYQEKKELFQVELNKVLKQELKLQQLINEKKSAAKVN
jgi:hypothetical protein